jgi:transcriptional regulator of heat shock response
LNALVDEYVVSAAPVPSRRLAQTYLTDVSSATIRNELMGLEADGLASSPHVSAGRIPTNPGFRIFVNSLMLRFQTQGKIAQKPVQIPFEQFDTSGSELEEHHGASLEILSEATGLLSVLWLSAPQRSVQQRGLARLLLQPEFHDAQALVPLMELTERATALGFLLENSLMNSRFKVIIGLGEPDNALAPFSVVAQRLSGRNQNGVVAVFGPTRMDYRTVIQAVSLAARVIGNPTAGI